MTEQRLFRTPAQMRAHAEALRQSGKRICLVPTMGALHEGHLSLLRLGRELADVVVLSVFVNPTQFGPSEDFDEYPRDERRDLELAAAEGVEVVYCPTREAMYSPTHQTTIDVANVARGLCGAARPGHFRGVATVVAKLFNATRPHVAVFGRKDYQQLAVIRAMVADLDFGIEIVGAPIVREHDGLALSSRNRYLSQLERQRATQLHAGLRAAADAFASGLRDPAQLAVAIREPLSEQAGIELEYVELRDAKSLAPVADPISAPAVALVAARVGSTRLIDNMILGEPDTGRA